MTEIQPLTITQKERLRALSGHVTRSLQMVHKAQIEQQTARLPVLVEKYRGARETYDLALRAMALMVGDLVEVTVEGEFLGRQALVTEVRTRDVCLAINGHTVAARAYEVRFVEPELGGTS